MKKFFSILLTIIVLIIFVGLGILLGLKLKSDMMIEKEQDIQRQNIQAESEYLCDSSNKKLSEIIAEIEQELNIKVEVADIGSLDNIDIYFVTKVDNDYKYIVKEQVDGNEKYKVAEDNSEEAKYIVSLKTLEFDTCILSILVATNICFRFTNFSLYFASSWFIV